MQLSYKLFRMYIATCFIFCSLISCDYVDIFGFISGQDTINFRMRELNSLPETKFDLTIDTENFSFLVISDCHYYKENFGYIKSISEDSRFADISFLILNGDNVQSGQQYQYDYLLEDIKTFGKPIYAVLGNHDTYNDGYPLFKKYFGRSVYVLHIGNTDLFILDTANSILGVDQRKWITRNMQNSKAKNKLIFTHASPFDETTPDAFGSCSFAYQEEVDFLVNTCEKYGVQYCITGHLHEYGEVTVRGTKYIKLYQQAKSDKKFAKVTIKSGKVNVEIY